MHVHTYVCKRGGVCASVYLCESVPVYDHTCKVCVCSVYASGLCCRVYEPVCVTTCVWRSVCLCGCVCVAAYEAVCACCCLCLCAHGCACVLLPLCSHACARVSRLVRPAVVTSGTGLGGAPVVKCAVCPQAAALPPAPFRISGTITCTLNLHSSICHAPFLLLSISCNTYSLVPDFKIT